MIGMDSAYSKCPDVSKCWFKDKCNKFGTPNCSTVCTKFTQTDYLFQLSNLPKVKQVVPKMDVTELSEYAYDLIDKIIQDVEFFVKSGYNLYLYGETGSGKTSWAIKILGTYFMTIAPKTNFTVRGLFINVPSLFRDIKLHMSYKSDNFYEMFHHITKCDLVVWDEIGQTDPTAFESQWLYSLINDRMLAQKSNIFTSNLSPDQLDRLDKRIGSRICTGSDCIEITGNDRRCDTKYTNYLSSQDVIGYGGGTGT